MVYKKVIGAALAVILAAGAFPAAATNLSFSFWGSYKDLELWKQMSEQFEEAHPDIAIELQFTPNDYGEKLQLQLISQSAADVLLMEDENYPTYAARGYLEDLGPYIERDRAELKMDDFFPTAMDAFTYRGLVAGLPWDGMAVMMFYNKDLFDASAIPYPTAEWTWDDFRRIAKQLTKDTNGDGRIDQFGGMQVFAWLDFQPLFWSYGAEVLNEDRTRCIINSPQAIAAARFMQELKFTDHSMVWYAELQGLNQEAQLLTGRIGMTPAGIYVTQTLGNVKGGMRWGMCRMPRGPTGKQYTRVSWDGISMNARMKGSPSEVRAKKEAAWLFLKYFLSEEGQRTIAKAGRGVPVVREYAWKYYVDPDTEVEEEVALEAMEKDGRLTPATTKFLAVRRAIDQPFQRMERENPAARGVPETILPEIEQRVNEVLASEPKDFGAGRVKPKEKSAAPFEAAGAIVALMAFVVLIWLSKKTDTPLHDLAMMVKSRKRRAEAFWGILFASPWMIGFSLFLAFPIVFSLVLSFSAWDPYDPVSHRVFIGLDNYVRALANDPLVWIALQKTFTYAVIAVPVTLACALGLAMLLNQNVRGIGVFRTLFYVPNVVGGVATSIMWLYIFNPIFGPINGGLAKLNHLLDQTPLAFINLPEPQWLNDPRWAMPGLFIMMLWSTGGGAMIIFLAGLQGIPRHLYEAAELDGAGRWRSFWNITLPMLSPTLFFNLIMGMIGALQVFMQALILLGQDGGTDNQLLFFVLYLYRKAFIDYEFGYAAALAWILFAIILGFTLLVLRSSALWVYYEGEKR